MSSVAFATFRAAAAGFLAAWRLGVAVSSFFVGLRPRGVFTGLLERGLLGEERAVRLRSLEGVLLRERGGIFEIAIK